MGNYNYKPATYEVTACGQVYYYALHSGRKNKIIFLSQVLNILEYVLFRRMKDGFRADGGKLTEENFPFEVARLRNRQPDAEPWENRGAIVSAIRTLLQDYYDGALKMLESGKSDDSGQDAEPPAERPERAAPFSGSAEVWNP